MKLRKWTALLLAVLLCLSLAACKDKAVQEVESVISAVGGVTLNSRGAINAARAAYDALTDEQKKSVENLEQLTDAEEAYTSLVISASSDFTDKFGDISEAMDDELWEYALELIRETRDEYEDLNPDVRKMVDGVAKSANVDGKTISDLLDESEELIETRIAFEKYW